MKMNRKQVRNSLIVAILIAVLCASSYYVGVSSSYVGVTSEVWVNPPFSEASYVVGQYNSTYYYAKNCTTGKFDYLSSNAAYVIQAAINALTSGGKIFFKDGTYALGATDLTVTFPNAHCEFAFIGETEGGVIFTSSATKLLDVTNTTWGGTLYGWVIRIENIDFRHSCTGADDITLDLLYSIPRIKNVRCFNSYYATAVQGIGIRTGLTAGIGWGSSMENVNCEFYGSGFDLSLDHTQLNNCMASQCKNYGYKFHDAYFVQGNNLRVFQWDAQLTTIYPFYFSNVLSHALFNPSVELKNATCLLTHPFFQYDNYAVEVPVYGFWATAVTGQVLSNTYANIKFYGSTYPYYTAARGTATIASGTNTVTVNHNMVSTPRVFITGTHSETADAVVTAVSATQFTITVPSNVTADRNVYWVAILAAP
jgi:hypothetical protein